MSQTKLRATASLAVAALAVGTLTSPAWALFDGEGRYVRGVGAESAQGFYLGAYAPPGNVEQGYPVWCTHMWRANPQPHHTASIATLTESKMWGPDELDATTPQMAWILNKYQGDKNNANARAALSYLIHANFEADQAGKSTQASVDLLVQKVREQASDVHALAAQYVAESKNSAAIGYESLGVEGDGLREGFVHGIALKNAAGAYVAGIPTTITLNGPAVFKETGTNTWSGVTGAEPLRLDWRATGNGEVTWSGKYASGVRKTLTKYGVDGSIQDTLSYGNRPASDPAETTHNGPSFRVIYDFQPVATSNVGDSKVVDGNTISDTLTASADPAYGDGQWLELDGVPVPVTYEGAAYLTGELPADETANVLAGVEPVATASLTFNGPGTQTATVDVPEGTDPGFITWVWRVVKAKQTTEVSANGRTYPASEFVHADWSDHYGLADETSSRRFNAKIDTTIAPRETKSGTYLVDDVWVTGFPENHADWEGSHNFKADVKTLDQSLYFFPEDLPVLEENKAKADLIATVTIPAKNGFYPTVGSTKFKAKEGNPAGTYVFVTSFAGDDRVKPMTTSVEDKNEQFKVEGPIPSLRTTATDAKDGDKNVLAEDKAQIVDKACYFDVKPGVEYEVHGVLMDKKTNAALLVDGKPVTSSAKFTPSEANGCQDVVFTFDARALAGTTTVVFEELKRDGITVATHADINDEGQTVTITGGDEDKGGASRSKALARTGADGALATIAIATLLGAAGVGVTYARRRNA